jgi:hypothetical protein
VNRADQRSGQDAARPGAASRTNDRLRIVPTTSGPGWDDRTAARDEQHQCDRDAAEAVAEPLGDRMRRDRTEYRIAQGPGRAPQTRP